jgi:hypothetical protein
MKMGVDGTNVQKGGKKKSKMREDKNRTLFWRVFSEKPPTNFDGLNLNQLTYLQPI